MAKKTKATKVAKPKKGVARATRATRATKATKAVVMVPKYKARGQYRIVESDSRNIMPSSNETRTED